jgi:hypothetical protein
VILTNTRPAGDDKKSTAFSVYWLWRKNALNGILMPARGEWNRKNGGKED